MARQVITTLIDDLDGKKADRTVEFSLDGTSYTIDLSDANAGKLRKALDPFINAGTRVGRGGAPRVRVASGGRTATSSDENKAIREWAVARPENLGAVVELARIEAAAGNVADAARLARNASAIHGDAADKLTLMFEAYVCADDLESAQGVADRMLLGSPLERARGRLRGAIVATLEGRFASAYSSSRRAVDDNRAFGLQSEVLQCLAIAVSMAHLASDRGAVVRYATELADTEANLNQDLGFDVPERANKTVLREIDMTVTGVEPVDELPPPEYGDAPPIPDGSVAYEVRLHFAAALQTDLSLCQIILVAEAR